MKVNFKLCMMSKKHPYAAFYNQASIQIDLMDGDDFETLKLKLQAESGIPSDALELLTVGRHMIQNQQKFLECFHYEGERVFLFAKDRATGWDTSKAPKNQYVDLLAQFLELLCQPLQTKTPESLIDLYMRTVFLKIDYQKTAQASFSVYIATLSDIKTRAQAALLEGNIDPDLAVFLTGSFLNAHQNGYLNLVEKYREDILMHQATLGENPNEALITFKSLFVQYLSQNPIYLQYHQLPALSDLQQRFVNKMIPLFEQTQEIEHVADTIRAHKGKYQQLRLFAIPLNKVFALVKFSLETWKKQPEPFRFQLLVLDGHITCFDIEISAAHGLSCCVLDSISDISDSALAVLKKMHDELNCSVVHFISTVNSRKNAAWPAQMQADAGSCMRFSLHLARQAAKEMNLHDRGRNVSESSLKTSEFCQMKVKVRGSETFDFDLSWLICLSWSELPPNFIKYSQSTLFFEGHHPNTERGPIKAIVRVEEKAKRVNSTPINVGEADLYLRGPIARQSFFMQQASLPSAGEKNRTVVLHLPEEKLDYGAR